ALFRDRIGQNHVERRDPIGRDKEQRFAEIEDFTDLPAPQFFYSRKIDNRLRVGLHLAFFPMAGLIVKPRARILHGHDWVFSSEVLKIFGDPADGDVISLKDGRDKLIGSAIYNSKSQIVARRFSRQRQDLDLDFFRRRIAQASEYRDRRRIDPQRRRVVWSESDGLPGVILDRYGDYLVLQTLTLAVDLRKDLIVKAIVDL